MLALAPPRNVKELQYYRDLWARRSNMLAPLTSLIGECGQTKVTKSKGTKKVPWYWAEVHQETFDDLKATIAKDLHRCLNQTVRLRDNTQSSRPLAFFSRKLSVQQQKYSVTKIELLAMCVCVCVCSGNSEPGGSCNHAIPIATSPPPGKSSPYVAPGSTTPPISPGSFLKGVPMGST
jgi:hypothetical protein